MERQLNDQTEQPHGLLGQDLPERTSDGQDVPLDKVTKQLEASNKLPSLLPQPSREQVVVYAARQVSGLMQDQQAHTDTWHNRMGQEKGSANVNGQRNLPSTFYEVLAQESDRNDKAAMISALWEIKNVIQVFRLAMEEACHDMESSQETTKVAGLARLTSLVECFQKFSKEWLSPFIKKFEGNLSCVANYSDADIDNQRSSDMENHWLPLLRKTLLKHQIKIPRALHNLPEHYAFLSFGILFYSDHFRSDQFWTAYPFGIEEGVGDLDNKEWPDGCLMKAFLTSKEPFASLQAYKQKNVLLHCLSEKFGGAKLTKENQNRLEKMKTWLETWSGLDECDINMMEETGNRKAAIIWRLQRKKKYEESTYKLNPSTYYIKCPGCDYIVVFPKPKGMDVGTSEMITRSIKRADGSKKSIWVSGKNGAHKLDLANVVFDSPFKMKWAMQKHITECQGCANKVMSCYFGNRRQKRKDNNNQKTLPRQPKHPSRSATI